MPTAKKPARSPRARPEPSRRIRNDPKTRARAVRELGINVPIMVSRVVGGRLQLKLYGGQVLYWPAKAPVKGKATK